MVTDRDTLHLFMNVETKKKNICIIADTLRRNQAESILE